MNTLRSTRRLAGILAAGACVLLVLAAATAMAATASVPPYGPQPAAPPTPARPRSIPWSSAACPGGRSRC
jgi:hypothetical protein